MPIDSGIQQCSYIRRDGRRCGSPASGRACPGGKPRCYHHDHERYPDPLAITPQLREIANLLADPLFEQYLGELAERCVAKQDVTQELINTLNMFLSYDFIEKHSPVVRM